MVEENVAWLNCDVEDLWLFDKLLLSKKLGYVCGPRGVDVPSPGVYVTRPCVNITGMGIGASFTYLSGETDYEMPAGYFWSEVFKGAHLSIDYIDGKQVLAVRGYKSPRNPLWKWSRWVKVSYDFVLPPFLQALAEKYKYMNVELIGGKIIEVHLRLNPDWISDDVLEVIPVFRGDTIKLSNDYEYIESKDYLREGFYIRRSNEETKN